MVGATSRTPLQQLSKLALGKDHRLTVAHAFLRGDDAFLDVSSLVASTGVPETTVFNEVAAMHRLGVLNRLEDRNRVLYVRIDGPFWTWCQELISSMEESEGRAAHSEPDA